MKPTYLTSILLLLSLTGFGQAKSAPSANAYDILIRNGLIYDGAGLKPYKGDIGIRADRVVAVGKLTGASTNALTVIDANGLAVAPGFINVLSHTGGYLLRDGRSMSDLKQGVTTEVFGETSWGPVRSEAVRQHTNLWLKGGGIKDTCDWTTLREFMLKLEHKGITPNIASYVGAGEVRMNVLGEDDVKPTPDQLARMKAQVREAMEGGALGLTTMLVYPPNTFADTDELIALSREAARCGGRYIVHMRSEGDRLEEGVQELIRIGKEAGLPVELYHFKAAGMRNWPKVDRTIALINEARRQGQDISANMYTYTAGATGLTSCLPPYVFNGGFMAGWKRLQNPDERRKIAEEVRHQITRWENYFTLSGSPDNILLAGFEQDSLKKYESKTLRQIATLRGKDPLETVMDLIVQDKARVETIYFLMSEENIKKELRQPWVSFGSDAPSTSEELTQFGKEHPRAFGNFARLLGKYVRDENVISLEEAVRRLTSLPATNHKLTGRGLLKPGYFADVVIFDPATIADKATFENPFQYAVGVQHVFINGKQVLKNGEHTGVFPGRALWGPGQKEKLNVNAPAQPRARDLGIPLDGKPGPYNAITDVNGVEVGMVTLMAGSGPLVVGKGPVRTGVTAILPRGKTCDPVFANWYSLNGNGEMTGTTWITESGFLETPILITNTHSVGVARDAAVAWEAKNKFYKELGGGFWFSYPVVAETYDGVLNDINGFHLTPAHVTEALDKAKSGPVAEGAVGGGTGMICLGFKGGTGTASRQAAGYTVGVLVQANFGGREQLTIAGVPVGRALLDTLPWRINGEQVYGKPKTKEPSERGSIIAIVATDAPLLPHQLKRIAQRVPLGIGKMGGMGGNSSGDIFLAFSTANPRTFDRDAKTKPVTMLTNDAINPLFDATVQATEEAILNALVAARDMTGINDNFIPALPHERVRQLLKQHNRLLPAKQ